MIARAAVDLEEPMGAVGASGARATTAAAEGRSAGPGADQDSLDSAGSGSAAADAAAKVDPGRMWDALREVMDPEIPISLVDLGLIYDVRVADGGAVEVDLTFTATACPCMAFIRFDIEERLRQEDGVEEVRIQEVWNPPWTKARISEEGRRRLKEMGVSM